MSGLSEDPKVWMFSAVYCQWSTTGIYWHNKFLQKPKPCSKLLTLLWMSSKTSLEQRDSAIVIGWFSGKQAQSLSSYTGNLGGWTDFLKIHTCWGVKEVKISLSKEWRQFQERDLAASCQLLTQPAAGGMSISSLKGCLGSTFEPNLITLINRATAFSYFSCPTSCLGNLKSIYYLLLSHQKTHELLLY